MSKKEKKERTTPVHATSARLYEAAAKMAGAEGQTQVARLIHATPQMVRNWEDRGVSVEGMLDAQQYIGCSAVWLRSGAGPMVVGEPFVQQDAAADGGLADALKLTCETATELQLLSVFRLANKDERDFIGIAVERIRERLRREVFGNDPQ